MLNFIYGTINGRAVSNSLVCIKRMNVFSPLINTRDSRRNLQGLMGSRRAFARSAMEVRKNPVSMRSPRPVGLMRDLCGVIALSIAFGLGAWWRLAGSETWGELLFGVLLGWCSLSLLFLALWMFAKRQGQ